MWAVLHQQPLSSLQTPSPCPFTIVGSVQGPYTHLFSKANFLAHGFVQARDNLIKSSLQKVMSAHVLRKCSSVQNKTETLEKGFQPPPPLPWGAGQGQAQTAGFGSSSAGQVLVEVGMERFGKKDRELQPTLVLLFRALLCPQKGTLRGCCHFNLPLGKLYRDVVGISGLKAFPA